MVWIYWSLSYVLNDICKLYSHASSCHFELWPTTTLKSFKVTNNLLFFVLIYRLYNAKCRHVLLACVCSAVLLLDLFYFFPLGFLSRALSFND